MSGDVQPRKRKDKRKKKEDGSLGMIHEPVSSNKFRNENEDRKVFDLPEQGEKIHVQNEHGIGGNIWVKIVFFCLLGLLVGAVGLIYLKSQGSSDVDLPTLEESRFADYFTGWLDDNTNGEHEHEHEHDAMKIEHHDHSQEDNDEPDDQEEMEADEENENEEEDQSVEDTIYNLFGVQNDDESDEVQKTSTILNKDTESEELKAQKEVNEDEEDGGDISDETEEEEIDGDGHNEHYETDELEEKNDDRDDDNEMSNENLNENNNYGASVMEEYNLHQTRKAEHQGVNKDKKFGVKQRVGNENDDNKYVDDDDDDDKDGDEVQDKDEDENDDNEDSNNENEESSEKGLGEEESGDEEEEKLSANLKGDDELGYKEIDISEEDLDELEIEPDNDMKDEFREGETERSFIEESKYEKSKDLETEMINEEEEVTVDAAGVAIKLGVGIALIIVAHLVLVQKWKSVSNAASDEKTSLETETAKGKNETENLRSSVEPVISRRQTLLPESVLFNDDMDELVKEDEGEDDYEEEEEEEDFEDNEKVCLEEENGKEEFEALKESSWYNYKEPLWEVKSQGNEIESKTELIANEELEEELEDGDEEDEDGEGREEDEDGEDREEDEDGEDREEDEDEDEDEDGEEDGDEEGDEDEEIEEEEEEDGYEEDQFDENNDFTKQKVLDQDAEELSSQEKVKDNAPVAPPRARRDGRGAQNVDEDPIKHFEEMDEVDEGHKDPSRAGDETSSSQDSETNNQNKPILQKDEWSYRQELEFGDEQFENNPKAAVEAYDRVLSKKPTLLRALIGRARALDHRAEKEKSNKYLRQAIDAYKSLLLNNGNLLDDETYVKLAERCIERMRFAGALASSIEIHKVLILKYPNTPKYRNMLAVTYLMMNKIPQARVLLKETLSLWPENGFALVHYGFILKTSDDNMEEGAKKLMAGIQTQEEGVMNGMFFFHLGDALHRLGRGKEAMEWYELGVKEGLFLSKYQRSLYNVNRLKGQPWWTKEDTTYQDFFTKLEKNWREIRREGLELLNARGVNLFKEEAENLKDTGDWKQLDLYFRGKKTPSCIKAPITCSLVGSFQPAATCTRGQIKFSVMLPNTHVWPHCGPTNCRLRSHLGLVVPKHTFIRVAEETRSWEEGKFIIFDDSFEHEVWHNGTGPRLVLIVDVWHPELTNDERRQLSPI